MLVQAADEQYMASDDGSAYLMDPAEMLWDCSISVICTGEDVVVDLATTADAPPVTRLAAGRAAANRAVRYTSNLTAA